MKPAATKLAEIIFHHGFWHISTVFSSHNRAPSMLDTYSFKLIIKWALCWPCSLIESHLPRRQNLASCAIAGSKNKNTKSDPVQSDYKYDSCCKPRQKGTHPRHGFVDLLPVSPLSTSMSNILTGMYLSFVVPPVLSGCDHYAWKLQNAHWWGATTIKERWVPSIVRKWKWK